MEVIDVPLPAWITWFAALASGCALALAIARAPWRRLRGDAPAHVWCGGIVILAVLWTLQPSVFTPASTHLLGAAAYTLLAGPALAAVGSAVALAIAVTIGGGDWTNLGAAYIVVALVPIAVTWMVLQVAQRALRAHFLVHVFVNGWVGGALSLIASQAIGDGITLALVRTPMPLAGADLVALAACLASVEAMLTGIVVTLFALAHPQILRSVGIGARPPSGRERLP